MFSNSGCADDDATKGLSLKRNRAVSDIESRDDKVDLTSSPKTSCPKVPKLASTDDKADPPLLAVVSETSLACTSPVMASSPRSCSVLPSESASSSSTTISLLRNVGLSNSSLNTVVSEEMSAEKTSEGSSDHVSPGVHIIDGTGSDQIQRNDEKDDGKAESQIVQSSRDDAMDPSKVHERVHAVVEKWGSITPIPPDKFLQKLLLSRNYSARFVGAIDVRNRHPWQPSMKQMVDYDRELVDAVRNSDLEKLKALTSSGRSLTACNKFSESIMHMACRRSNFEVVKFMIDNGANILIVDDYGRTPLHDACWRAEPRFDIVTLLLDKNLEILRMTDVRGSCPLNYVREEHWVHWCAYFFHQKEKYWAKLNEPEISTI